MLFMFNDLITNPNANRQPNNCLHETETGRKLLEEGKKVVWDL